MHAQKVPGLPWPSTILPLAAAAVFLSAAPAHAFEPAPLGRIGPTGQTPALEMRVIEHEQRMLRAQQEHRLNLQQDREAMRYRGEEMRIPQMQRNCTLRLQGSKSLETCR